ncbi:ATP-binding cassette domain-containing protein [Streptomyces sp. NPDC029554]|uniref:ATP-binding cassette domain-containing protein n=1 Tax=Streptomyces sp. NPDC029554 TaxID=3155126 RepID=UPI0033F19381
MEALVEFDPESSCGTAIRRLPGLFGSFTLDQLDAAVGGAGIDRGVDLRVLEAGQFIRRDLGFDAASQVYLATAKGLRWAQVLDYLMASPDALIKSPVHPQGRALIVAFWHPVENFTSADLEAPLELPAGSLHEVLSLPFFTRASASNGELSFSMTSTGRSNAAVLDRAWREMHKVLRSPDVTHSAPPSAPSHSAPSVPYSAPSAPKTPQQPLSPSHHHLAIFTRGLARQFRPRGRGKEPILAVKGLDLAVQRGELVGFLGPNGAGKTTTMRMLTTLLSPTAGQAIVAGHDLRKDPRAVRRRIGYVPQSNGSSEESTVVEELLIQGRLHGMSKAATERRSSELLAQLGLLGLEKRLSRNLSGGQRRRLDIALGLVHSPEIIFLDEPTTGLDPQSRVSLWNNVRWMRMELGLTAFLTTHYLDEAEALCDRILIMDDGQIIAEGTTEHLKAMVVGDTLVLRVPAEYTARAAELAGRLEGSFGLSASDGLIRLRVPHSNAVTPTLLRALEAAHIPTTSFQVNQPSLNDVFLKLTGRNLQEDGVTGHDEPSDHFAAGLRTETVDA